MNVSRLSFYDKEDRPWPGARLTSAAIIGHTTQTGARIWIRVWEPGDYCLVLSKTKIDVGKQPCLVGGKVELFSTVGKPEILDAHVVKKSINFDTDNTAVFDVQCLAPGTRYYYAVFAVKTKRRERWEIGRDHTHSFRTQRKDSAAVTFGLFSYHMPFKGESVLNQDMWRSFGELATDMDADFVVGCGDQVYADGDDGVSIWEWLKRNKKAVSNVSPESEQIEIMKSWYRDIYRGYWGNRALRHVFRSFPTYMIWDDHEIMDGWGSYTDTELSNMLDTLWEWEDPELNLPLARKMFEAAKAVYHEYVHSHNPLTQEDQWDYGFRWSDLSFFVFDVRGTRDFNRPEKKILGPDQGHRFDNWLRCAASQNAAALFIVSPVPIVHLSDFIVNTLDIPAFGLADDLRDEWEHESNHEERNSVLSKVFEFSDKYKKPVVFLSGNVHIGAAFKLACKEKPGAKVFQLTSSAITYCKAPGKLLKLVVRKRGEVKGCKERTTFTRLQVFEDNNFGFVHRTGKDKSLKLSWDLYGSYCQIWCMAGLNQAAFLRVSLSSMPSTNFTFASRSAS